MLPVRDNASHYVQLPQNVFKEKFERTKLATDKHPWARSTWWGGVGVGLAGVWRT